MRAQAVVVEVEVLQGNVLSKESYQWCGGVKAKGIIVEVDGREVGKVLNRGEEGGDGLGNLAEKSAGEDVV
jgi:hypothetical protein